MPDFTVPIHERDLREFNTCHNPKGPAGGQFCSKEEAVPRPNTEYEKDPEAWTRYFAAGNAWDRKMTLAVSLGKISPADAKVLGWRGESNAEKGYEPLPETLYHVSTGFNEILRQGLKTRSEIGGVHRGLGGGSDDTISFTTDLKTARSIRAAILEARRVARGEITAEQLFRMAKAQPTLVAQTSFGRYMQSQGARSASELLVSLYAGKAWYTGNPMPENLANLLKGEVVERPGDSKDPLVQAAYEKSSKRGLGMLPSAELPSHVRVEHEHRGRDEMFAQFIRRKMTDDERIEATFEMYKRYATAREHAGGRMDPLFFMTDHKALAKVKVKDIKILQFKPRRGTYGYRVSALGEWRVHTGAAVRYTGIVESA